MITDITVFASVAVSGGLLMWFFWPLVFPAKRDFDAELRALDEQIAYAKAHHAKRSHLYAAKEAIRRAQLVSETAR